MFLGLLLIRLICLGNIKTLLMLLDDLIKRQITNTDCRQSSYGTTIVLQKNACSP